MTRTIPQVKKLASIDARLAALARGSAAITMLLQSQDDDYALATARDLGGVVAETRRGLPGFDLWRHPAVDRELTVWRSARERTREGKRWAAPAEVVAWLAEVLEWAWARERSAGVVQ